MPRRNFTDAELRDRLRTLEGGLAGVTYTNLANVLRLQGRRINVMRTMQRRLLVLALPLYQPEGVTITEGELFTLVIADRPGASVGIAGEEVPMHLLPGIDAFEVLTRHGGLSNYSIKAPVEADHCARLVLYAAPQHVDPYTVQASFCWRRNALMAKAAFPLTVNPSPAVLQLAAAARGEHIEGVKVLEKEYGGYRLTVAAYVPSNPTEILVAVRVRCPYPDSSRKGRVTGDLSHRQYWPGEVPLGSSQDQTVLWRGVAQADAPQTVVDITAEISDVVRMNVMMTLPLKPPTSS